MNTICMNSKNSKTSVPHRLLLNFTDKIVSAFTIHGKL